VTEVLGAHVISTETAELWLSTPVPDGMMRLLTLSKKSETSVLVKALARDLDGKILVGEILNAPEGRSYGSQRHLILFQPIRSGSTPSDCRLRS